MASYAGGTAMLLWVLFQRRGALRVQARQDIETNTKKLMESKVVWAMVTGTGGKFINTESLKGYLRLKKYKETDVNLKKKVPVTDHEMVALLKAAIEVAARSTKRKNVFKNLKKYAKKKWEETCKGTELISPISPSPDAIIDECLREILPNENDVMYDLGCGDARWLCRASELYRCKCVGLEIEKGRIALAHENIQNRKLTEFVTIRDESIIKADISDATLILFYLFPEAMEQLGKTLKQRVKSGTRLVAVQFRFPPKDWKPERIYRPDVPNSRTLYFYTVP
jgi:hypothetical protein